MIGTASTQVQRQLMEHFKMSSVSENVNVLFAELRRIDIETSNEKKDLEALETSFMNELKTCNKLEANSPEINMENLHSVFDDLIKRRKDIEIKMNHKVKMSQNLCDIMNVPLQQLG